MIILNDIWAYVFGFFFGRTPLIQVSPKKTWEGFIGGGIATVICGIVVSLHLFKMLSINYFLLFIIQSNITYNSFNRNTNKLYFCYFYNRYHIFSVSIHTLFVQLSTVKSLVK